MEIPIRIRYRKSYSFTKTLQYPVTSSRDHARKMLKKGWLFNIFLEHKTTQIFEKQSEWNGFEMLSFNALKKGKLI